MFWRKKDEPKAAPVAPAPPVSATVLAAEEHHAAPTGGRSDLDVALESIAEVLRARGRYAFSVGDEDVRVVSSAYERWAGHIVVRSPPPGAVRGEPLPPGRDWRSMVEFASNRAKKEQAWAQGSVRDMREAIFSLVESFSRTSYAQGRQNDTLRRRLAGLTQAVETGSLEALKREALMVADAVTQVLEEQQQAAQSQAEALKARVACLGEQLEETRREGETDPLTRLANRRLLDVTISRALTIASVMDRPVTLMMVDVDHFKAINDSHGHPAGDQVLCALADTLQRTFPRRSDLVARYGGEEFAVLLSDTHGADSVMLAERLLEAVRNLRVEVDGKTISLTVSVGLAESLPSELPADLCRRADRSLYAAKNGGRNRLVEARSLSMRPPVRAA